MDWDKTIYQQVMALYDEGNLNEFEALLKKYPEYLRDKNGEDIWMSTAAMDGNLDALKLVVGLGLDVNLSKDILDPNDPFCLVEGPIIHAAAEGHTEIVHWLLERGAKINYTVNGNIRSLPLLRAARHGHIEIVKLLVEHGAAINFSHNGHTPLSQAIKYGKVEVASFLRSVGALE